jgi:hypothetical protein
VGKAGFLPKKARFSRRPPHCARPPTGKTIETESLEAPPDAIFHGNLSKKAKRPTR